MIFFPSILADGFPTPLIFFLAVVALFWGLGKIFGSDEKTDPQTGQAPHRPGRRAPTPQEIEATRRRMREMLGMEVEPARVPPPLPQKDKQKKSRVAAQPTRPAAQPVAQQPRPAPVHQPTPAASQPIVAKPPTTEIARNVRLLLQPGALGEAFVLNEILGKPKSMDD